MRDAKSRRGVRRAILRPGQIAVVRSSSTLDAEITRMRRSEEAGRRFGPPRGNAGGKRFSAAVASDYPSARRPLRLPPRA